MTPQTQTTHPDATEMLDAVVRGLVAALSPRRIYLFGSNAYGQPTPDSDVDLLIVVEDASRLTVEDLTRAHQAFGGTFLPIELHFRSRGSFERRSRMRTSLEHEVATRGRLLYAA